MNLLKSLIIVFALTVLGFESRGEDQPISPTTADEQEHTNTHSTTIQEALRFNRDGSFYTHFTTDIEEAELIDAGLVYNEEDFKKQFGDINSLSDTEREAVYEKIFDRLIYSVRGCEDLAEDKIPRVTSLLTAIQRMCQSMEEVIPMQEYDGVTCHCVYQSPTGETFYLKKETD